MSDLTTTNQEKDSYLVHLETPNKVTLYQEYTVTFPINDQL
jgi:hypothetical protein